MYAQFNSKHSAIAKKILSKSKPNKNYIPELKIYWPIKDGSEIRFWKPGCKTIKTVPFEAIRCCKNSFRGSQREIKTSYFRYYPKYNALECGILTINGLRKKPDEIRNWEFYPDNETYPHFMIFFGDPYPYGPDGNEVLSNPKDKYYNTKIYHLLYTAYTRMQELGRHVVIKRKSVSEFLDYNNIKSTHYTQMYAWTFAEEYYKKHAPRPTNQKILNAIEINNSIKEKEIKSIFSTNHSVIPSHDIALCENINGYAIIRIFATKVSSSIYHLNCREYIRYCIAPDKTVTAFYKQQYYNHKTLSYEGEYWWEKINGSVFSYICNEYRYDLRNFESIANLSQVKHLSCTFNTNNNGLVNLAVFFGMLRHPILEQLYKAGYPELAKLCLDDGISHNIKLLFGDNATEKKSLTLYQNLGVNKIILKKMEEIVVDRLYGTKQHISNVLPIIKEFCGSDIRTLDAKSINDWFNFSQELHGDVVWIYKKYTSLFNLIGRYSWNFKLSDITEEQKEDYRKEIRHLFHLWKKEHINADVNIVRIWRDIIGQLEVINNDFIPRNTSLLSMRNYQDLVNTHDCLIAYAGSIQKMALDKQEQSKRFKEMQEIRKERYEIIDNDFRVLVPEHLSQIIDEGIALHHCVRTYTNLVADSRTTILFLRRSNAKETPFYTIEVQNGAIIQIHGFGNKWIGNDLDAARFMYRYCKLKNIHCDMNILTNKGQGYSASRQDHWEPNDIIGG